MASVYYGLILFMFSFLLMFCYTLDADFSRPQEGMFSIQGFSNIRLQRVENKMFLGISIAITSYIRSKRHPQFDKWNSKSVWAFIFFSRTLINIQKYASIVNKTWRILPLLPARTAYGSHVQTMILHSFYIHNLPPYSFFKILHQISICKNNSLFG